MNHQTGKLILISGPSGTGKSTVIARLMRLRDDVCFSVSATTRDPRPGEVDGKDYFWRRCLGREVHRTEPPLRRCPYERKRHAEPV